MTIELKPCPFCGGKGNEILHVDPTGDEWSLFGCGKCCVWYELEEQWNNRAKPEPGPATKAVMRVLSSVIAARPSPAHEFLVFADGSILKVDQIKTFLAEQER